MPFAWPQIRRGARHRSTSRARAPSAIPALVVFAGIALWALLASPPLYHMFRELQDCPVNDIAEVRIYDFDAAHSGSYPGLVMRGKDVATFMGFISNAESAHPNHPRGGSTLFAEVDTARWGTRHLRITATDNCGVLIYIESKKLGDGSAWGAGPWRNDDLIRVFSNYAAEKRANAAKANNKQQPNRSLD